MRKIAGAGIACLDHIVVSPQVQWGDTSLVSRYSIQPGGLVAMALIACSRLEADCRILTLLGDDETGNMVASELEMENIDLLGVLRIESGKTPFSFVHVDEHSGERTIFHRSGSGLDVDINPSCINVIDGCSVLLIDDIYMGLSVAAAKYAQSHSIPVVADVIPNDLNADLLRHVDILIVPRHFLRETGFVDDPYAALDLIHDLGPTTALITLGSDGYVWSHMGTKGCGNAFRVDAKDTTGAGDVFHGAFAFGVANQWSIPDCAEFASAVAAIKCMGTGPDALPSYKQTIDFLLNNGCSKSNDLEI